MGKLYDILKARALCGSGGMSYEYGTATDVYTQLPQTLYISDSSFDIEIKGKSAQSGTPSTSSPVYLEGVGDRTANLIDADTVYEEYKTDNGYEATAGTFNSINVYFTEADVGKTFTLSASLSSSDVGNMRVQAVIDGSNKNGNQVSGSGVSTVSFTVSAATDYWHITYGSGGSNTMTVSDVMLNSGKTALDYEPYGYKIPVICGEQTTNYYLGKTQTSRQIKKLVLDGTEDWSKSRNDDTSWFKMMLSDYKLYTVCLCTHYGYESLTSTNTVIGIYITNSGGSMRIRPENVATMTLEDFTTYLSQQYAAGTPVTVWYILDTAETAAENEPLLMIDEYADSLSTTISVTPGENELAIDTEIQPSEVSVSFTGWHPKHS